MYIYIFPGIHIQLGGSKNDIRLDIEKLARNGSRSNGKEIIGLGMSLFKVHFLKIWVVRAFFGTQYTKNTDNIKDTILKKF